MISQHYWTLETMPQNQKELLQAAWSLFKEPHEEYAKASSLLKFLLVITSENTGNPPIQSANIDSQNFKKLWEKFQYFVQNREKALKQATT